MIYLCGCRVHEWCRLYYAHDPGLTGHDHLSRLNATAPETGE